MQLLPRAPPPIFQAPPLSLCSIILNISFHPTKPSMSRRMGISSTSHPHSKCKEKGGEEQGKERGGRENREGTQGRKRHCPYLCYDTHPKPQAPLPSLSLPRTLPHALSLCKEARKEDFYLGTLSV